MFPGSTVVVRLLADHFKGVVVEILDVRSNFNGHFWNQRVDYPHKHLIRTKFAIFEKSKKYYICVLKFCQKWFS